MFHIVFDSHGAERLSTAMDVDDTLDGETILIRDDYSAGPIQDLFSEQGREERRKWWSTIQEETGSSLTDRTGEESDSVNLQRIADRMTEEEFDQIWVWVAPNARDVCGYYWTIAQLDAFSGRIYVLHLNNLPFISEKGNVFYPNFLSEIPSREFIKAKRLARPVTLAEFETDQDEWIKLAAENKNLRLLEGGKKIVQHGDDYLDQSLLHFLQPVFQKIPRLIHQYLSKSPDKINETYLTWRLKKMASSGVAVQQGEMVRQFVKAADEVSG